jgi:hypothetical protein
MMDACVAIITHNALTKKYDFVKAMSMKKING